MRSANYVVFYSLKDRLEQAYNSRLVPGFFVATGPVGTRQMDQRRVDDHHCQKFHDPQYHLRNAFYASAFLTLLVPEHSFDDGPMSKKERGSRAPLHAIHGRQNGERNVQGTVWWLRKWKRKCKARRRRVCKARRLS